MNGATKISMQRAPRDGTQILLHFAGGGYVVGFWNGNWWDDGDFESSMADSDFDGYYELPGQQERDR